MRPSPTSNPEESNKTARGHFPQATQIYFAPFHAAIGGSSASPCGSSIAVFRRAVSQQDWPYDGGDDPSFYAMRQFGGQLSWGVCRQDVRNNLRPNDIVVFFSFRKFEDTGDSEYRLCALATVERKVSQMELWQEKNLRLYRKYFNLLIRPSRSVRGGWEHFEPTSQVHDDWLWRISDHDGLRKNEFEAIQKTDCLESEATIKGRSAVIARNYVLFTAEPEKTGVLSKPPVVAWHSKGKATEEWNQDKFSQAVKQLTLKVAERANGRSRSLRIRNSQRAHRHIVFKMIPSEAENWRAQFLKLVRRH